MKLRSFCSKDDVFMNIEYGIAFDNAQSGDRCALLPILTSDFGLSQDKCALFDRVEYLLPHYYSA